MKIIFALLLFGITCTNIQAQGDKAERLNTVITREPAFYNDTDDKNRFGTDPVLEAKLKFIPANEPFWTPW